MSLGDGVAASHHALTGEADWRGFEKSFPFSLPTRIEYGSGVSARVAEVVAVLGERVAIVTDPGVRAAGLVDPIAERLQRAGMPTKVLSSVEPNPRAATIDAIAAAMKADGIDVIVGVGGGSVLDAAKAAAAVVAHGGGVLDYEGLDAVPGPAVPMVAIPTTAGTGSEATVWANVTDPRRQYKMAVGSRHIAPRVALVDPLLTVTLPGPLTAATGVDALTHAIEGYTARCSNPVSDALSLYAIELVTSHIERASADGSDMSARCAMMLGSLLAGIAFGNSDTAAVHAMAEALGGALDLGHGVANAICLPFVVRHNALAVPERTARIGRAMGLKTSGLPVAEAGDATVKALFALMGRLGIPSLRGEGVDDGHVPILAEIAMMNSGNPDNPIPMDNAAYEALFREALAWPPG